MNVEDFDAVVRAGVTRHQLNDWIRADGLQFPIDPGTQTILSYCILYDILFAILI